MTRPLALVTGGSAGIGLELARLLARDRHDLVITGSSERTESAAKDLRGLGVEVVAVQSDLATEVGNDAVTKAILETGRVPEVMIFNAGIAIGGAAFPDIDLDRHLDLVALNVLSPVRLAHALVPRMIAAGGGRILLVSSLSATTPIPFEGLHGPSKAFLSSFGHGLREELSGAGITVTIAHPGATATEFHARAGMGDTKFGDNTWKNDVVNVARQAYAAMTRGIPASSVATPRRRKQVASTSGLPKRRRPEDMPISRALVMRSGPRRQNTGRRPENGPVPRAPNLAASRNLDDVSINFLGRILP